MSSNQIRDLNKIYMEAVYGQSPEKEEAKRRKDDDLAGSPRKATPESGTGKYYKEGQPTKQQLAQREKREKIKSLTNQGKHKEASALHNEGLGTAGAALVGPMVGVNPAIAAGTTGAITGKKGRKTKKAIAAGTGAAVGGAMAGPVGAAIGAGVGGALSDEVKHVRKLVEKVKFNRNPISEEDILNNLVRKDIFEDVIYDLVEEGYDLSESTWDEVYGNYVNELVENE